MFPAIPGKIAKSVLRGCATGIEVFRVRRMPGFDGERLIRRLQAKNRKPTCVLFRGLTESRLMVCQALSVMEWNGIL